MWHSKGHDSTIDFIKNSIKFNRLAHAYLISGFPYIGKSTLALDIARAVNCTDFAKNNMPCSECRSCIRISTNNYTDISTLDFLNSKSSPIEELRENFLTQVYKAPYEGKYKIFIIENIDKMRSEHANLLLKTLEEPPAYVVIILISEDLTPVLDTILSRCQILDLHPTADISLLKNIFENSSSDSRHDLDTELIVKLSRGRIGWIMRVISDPTFFLHMQNLFDDMEIAMMDSFETRLKFSNTLAKNFKNKNADGFSDIDIMMTWWRDVIMIIAGNEESIININRLDILREVSTKFTVDQVINVIKMFDASKSHLNINANPLLVYDNLMINIPLVHEYSR